MARLVWMGVVLIVWAGLLVWAYRVLKRAGIDSLEGDPNWFE